MRCKSNKPGRPAPWRNASKPPKPAKLRRSRRLLECSRCHLSFATNAEYRQHVKQSSAHVRCPMNCPGDFRSKAKLLNHLYTSHKGRKGRGKWIEKIEEELEVEEVEKRVAEETERRENQNENEYHNGTSGDESESSSEDGEYGTARTGSGKINSEERSEETSDEETDGEDEGTGSDESEASSEDGEQFDGKYGGMQCQREDAAAKTGSGKMSSEEEPEETSGEETDDDNDDDDEIEEEEGSECSDSSDSLGRSSSGMEGSSGDLDQDDEEDNDMAPFACFLGRCKFSCRDQKEFVKHATAIHRVCIDCDAAFDLETEMIKHRATEHPFPAVPCLCGEKFEGFIGIARHIEKGGCKHITPHLFYHLLCFFGFEDSLAPMKGRLFENPGATLFGWMGMAFNSPREEVIWACECCEECFDDNALFVRHFYCKIGPMLWGCSYCGHKFFRPGLVLRHRLSGNCRGGV